MGYLEGLLGGFTSRKREYEAENYAEAQRAAEREMAVYNTLLSSPDPEIQALAATGMLESARPRKRKGGIRGWLGELEQSPTYASLQALIGKPVTVTEDVMVEPGAPGLPSKQIQPVAGVTAPSLEEAPMGTPAQSLTEPGAPAAKPISYVQQPGPLVGRPPTFETRTRTEPRRVFPTPEDVEIQQARGRAKGAIEGEVAGLVAAGIPESQARTAVLNKYQRLARGGAGGFQSIAGEMPDGTPAYGVFDRVAGTYKDPETGQPLQGFRPRTSTGSVSFGQDREAIARATFGMPFARLNQDQQRTVMAREADLAETESYRRGVGTGRARTETELNMPIGPTAARQFNVSPTTPLKDLANTIGLDDNQKDRVYALSQMDVLVSDIETLLPQVFPNVPSGFGGAIKSTLSLGYQTLSRDADLAKLDAAINASLAQIAQLTGQPGSRLSDTDLEIARSTLANLRPSLFGGDTLQTARARLSVIQGLLAKAKQSIPTSPQVAQPPPGSPGARPAAPALTPAGARGLDVPVQGWFVDAQGNVVQR